MLPNAYLVFGAALIALAALALLLRRNRNAQSKFYDEIDEIRSTSVRRKTSASARPEAPAQTSPISNDIPMTAMPAATALSGTTDEAGRLVRSRLLMDFVAKNKGTWNHDDWLRVLKKVRTAGYESLTDIEVGRLLEKEKAKYWQGALQVRPDAMERKTTEKDHDPAKETPSSRPQAETTTAVSAQSSGDASPFANFVLAGRTTPVAQKHEAVLIAERYNQDPASVPKHYKVREFRIANLPEMAKDSNQSAEFQFVEPPGLGLLWLIDLSRSLGYVVPKPQSEWDAGQLKSGGINVVFECGSLPSGLRYSKLEIVQPARFRETGSGYLEMVSRGILQAKPAAGEAPGRLSIPVVPTVLLTATPRPTAAFMAGPDAPNASMPVLRLEREENTTPQPQRRPKVTPRPTPADLQKSQLSAPQPSEPIASTLVSDFTLVTGEEVIAVYNESPDRFRSRMEPVRAGWSTVVDLFSKGKGRRMFGRLEDGNYWMVIRSSDLRYVVPYPGLEFDDAICQELTAIFHLKGHRPGYRFRKVKLLRPAVFSEHGLVEAGFLSLEQGEPDVDLG